MKDTNKHTEAYPIHLWKPLHFSVRVSPFYSYFILPINNDKISGKIADTFKKNGRAYMINETFIIIKAYCTYILEMVLQ